MKKILTLVLTCVLAFSLAGCGGSKDSSTTGSGDLSGKISLDGSTSMEKFVTALTLQLNLSLQVHLLVLLQY